MRRSTERKIREGEAILSKDHSEMIGRVEVLEKNSNPPISVRLSVPLLARLDAIAEAQHRKRGNLIQFALWEFVRTYEARNG